MLKNPRLMELVHWDVMNQGLAQLQSVNKDVLSVRKTQRNTTLDRPASGPYTAHFTNPVRDSLTTME